MLAKRIIPCLDIKDGRTVKGTQFLNLRDAGDPVELARKYAIDGADELVFLDITATIEKRKTLVSLVKEISKEIDIPFTVGGGIDRIEMVEELLHSGADKVSINSAGVKNPGFLEEISKRFGSQCLVLAVDANILDGDWKVYTKGGRHCTGIDLFEWVEQAQDLGVGEILFTSMNKDGTKSGFEIEALKTMSDLVSLPIIASGGAGTEEHFIELFLNTNVTGALAASIFHFNEVDIRALKTELANNKIAIRT